MERDLSMKENEEVELGVSEIEKYFGTVKKAHDRDEDCGSGKGRPTKRRMIV